MIEEIYKRLIEGFDPERDLPAPPIKDLIVRRIDKSELKDNGDGTFDYDGDLDFRNLNLKSLFEIPYKFRYVSGYFYCSFNELTSLKGAPEKVGGDFHCRYNKLTSLNGAPEKVGDDFSCGNNLVPEKDLLKTLKR